MDVFGLNDEGIEKEWRGGVFLCTTRSSLEADILESKLRAEGIPCLKRYKGPANFLEIAFGQNTAYPIDLYVPKETLEDARNIIVAVPLADDGLPGPDDDTMH